MKRIFLSIAIITSLIFLVITFTSSNNEFKGHVLSVNNSKISSYGIARLGEQVLQVKVLNGPHKNNIIETHNFLNGSYEYDELFSKDDKILLSIKNNNGTKFIGQAISLYRFDSIIILVGIFTLLLVLYAGAIGIKAIISFILSILIIWYIFIPSLSNNINIFWTTMGILILLSAIIIFLVAGFSKKGISAFLGTLSGFFITTLLTFIFGSSLELDGMNQPFAQNIALTTSLGVDLLQIFYSTIAIGASGAAMDIAMDIAATIEELHNVSPNMTRKELITSGFTVGKLVIGTITTTLLLAYSGSYLTMLMLFMERNTSLLTILNIKLISSELTKILIGSISLVIVAPFTAIISGFIYSSSKTKFLK